MFYTHGLSSRGKQLMRVDEEGSVAADGPSSPPAARGPREELDDGASVLAKCEGVGAGLLQQVPVVRPRAEESTSDDERETEGGSLVALGRPAGQ